MKTSLEEMAEFVAIVTAEIEGAKYPHLIARDCVELRRLAVRRKSLTVAHCNYMEQDVFERRDKKLRARIEEAAKKLGAVGVIFSGDPRGCVVKLKLPSGKTNDFLQEGICVPGA